MSKKLYEVTKAVDIFNKESPIPERYLIFTGPDGPYKESFPKNHTALLFKGQLYDWYGKKVKIAHDIEKVIGPFGYGLNNTAYETYLVKKKDGKLAIANLTTISCCYYNPRYPLSTHAKSEITGSIMINGQELNCKNWSFESLLDSPIEDTCFKVLEGRQKCQILIGVAFRQPSAITSNIYFWPIIEGHTGAIRHFVFENRKTIMEHSPIELQAPKVHRLTNVLSRNYVSNSLTFSNGGNKATTYICIPTGEGISFRRISTDAEVLLHAKGNPKIIWYYDPEL